MLQDIQRKFEEAFDIPFISNYGIDGRDVWYEIGPKNSAKEYFVIKIRFVNDFRLVMELVPDTYSKPFIQDLGYADEEKKKTFISFARILLEKKAKLQLQINRMAASVDTYDTWPAHWDHLALRISRSPISEGRVDHEDIILDWGMSMMAMVLSLANIVPVVIPDDTEITSQAEGNARRMHVTRYERSPINRMLCLAAKGYNCSVCGMNFEKTYGKIGINFIHVHHAVPVSQMGDDYLVDPEKELFPVCPNCHAMLHRCDPPLTVDELKGIIARANSDTCDPAAVL